MNLFGSFEHQFQQDLVWWLFRVDFRPQSLRLKKIALGKPVTSSAQKNSKVDVMKINSVPNKFSGRLLISFSLI